MTGPAFRWAVAVLVTIAAFAVATWICGAFVLPMHDGGVRWGIAGGLGVAIAALAALWGHSYAIAKDEQLLPGVQDADEPGTERADGRRRERPAGLARRGAVVGEVSLVVGEVPVSRRPR